MSCGVALAWATEAVEKGLLTETDTGGLRPTWGDGATYREMIRRIADRDGELYDLLAHGVTRAAARYGGEEFALAFGGNEMPGYHTGPGALLTYLSGARHSHLDSAGYALDQQALSRRENMDPTALARALFTEEARRQVLSSLVVCFFARGLYDLDTSAQCLEALGEDWDPESLVRLGEEILRRKHAFKVREGFDLAQLSIPKRALTTPAPGGVVDEAYLRTGLREMQRHLEGDDGLER
jgi:aldehyde:ferredoxin oxidoreductase